MNILRIADTFFDSFNSNHVILFVGQGISDEDIKDYIAKCPWSAVITTRRDPEFASFFANEERTPREFLLRSEIPARVLNRKTLPILRLFGVKGNREKDEPSWLRIGSNSENEYDMRSAIDMLQLLPILHNHVNPIVIIGVDSNVDWRVFGDELIYLLYTSTTNGTVSFWNVSNSVTQKYEQEALSHLIRLIEEKQFQKYEVSLVNVIRAREESLQQLNEKESMIPEDDYDIYYQGRHTISISKKDLLLFKNLGDLLTERTINKIRPLGRVMSRKWFANFLESSSSPLGPQWYGYLPQSDFHIKRSYEDALVQLVRKMLDGRGVDGTPIEIRPIILSGDPGSSKSISLAALAYRIYNEKINPVIFISKETFFGLNSGAGLDELDEAMQFLERKMEKDTRILVIWDSSTYKSGIDRARSLLEQLRNRGRRFVLVCSSYNINSSRNPSDSFYYYDRSNGQFVVCDESNAQVIDTANCYYVKAIREMNQSEITQFWYLAKDYSGINDATLSKIRKRVNEEKRTEIFDYYYLLISILRENLEQKLKREQSKVYPYVQKELSRVLGDLHTKSKVEKQSLPIYQALLAAGFEFDNSLKENVQESKENNYNPMDEKKFEDLQLCIAMFSRFKLSVPYGLVYTILIGEDDTEEYSENTRELYRIVTSDIPWLYYGEDDSGNYSFRFRNPLEADIYLHDFDFTGEKQIKLICHIIDIYGKDYRRNQCKDEAFTENLQSLLRMIGPNTEYRPFRTTHKIEHDNILGKLNVLIDKLKELKEYYGVVDEDAGFSSIIVTFTREYYGFIWSRLFNPTGINEPWVDGNPYFSLEAYEKRLEQLLYAITFAESCIEILEDRVRSHNISQSEKNHLNNQRNSLSVEIAQCNIRLEDLSTEYMECCRYCGCTVKEELVNRKLSYKLLYSMLLPVINNDPTNGYAYNTLFKAFQRVYGNGNLSDAKKLQYLSEIMQVVYMCESLDSEISNRGSHGNDELTTNINTIKDYSTGFMITLDSIRRHREGIPPVDEKERICFELYDEMLESNNAAAITFICQKELRFSKGTRKLNDDQLKRCKSVYNFMVMEDNYDCVSTDLYALSMLIRVAWMVYNKSTLTNSPECQLTRLNIKQWQQINRFCQQYDNIVGERKDPLIMLLFALSIVQVNGLQENGFQDAIDVLRSLDEDIFYQRRMWTPFMLCDENASPYEFSGTVLSTKNYSGRIRVSRIPLRLNNEAGIRFRQYNLGRTRKMPEIGHVLTHLELGIGYTGFSVYTEEGRKEKEARA